MHIHVHADMFGWLDFSNLLVFTFYDIMFHMQHYHYEPYAGSVMCPIQHYVPYTAAALCNIYGIKNYITAE